MASCATRAAGWPPTSRGRARGDFRLRVGRPPTYHPDPTKEDPMARHRRPAPSGGSLYQRASRHTGHALPTWWISYYVDGKKHRESAHTTDLETAQRLLRARLHALDEGTYVEPERER